jgi:hypothetical protein
MAHTIKLPNGTADASVTISGTETTYAFGPPSSGQGQYRGVFIRQVSGASGTWRWTYDEPTPGTDAPTTYSFAPRVT